MNKELLDSIREELIEQRDEELAQIRRTAADARVLARSGHPGKRAAGKRSLAMLNQARRNLRRKYLALMLEATQ